eukprot:TRINITY_DN14818_c0_g1_i27.p1 TRINITY_DN14818_c0_g1~~TRINITY_DN14818_c0_g1_i27.p1  ORF type:complete len:322 (-),score=82.91 TRINITY_DN14818_c0_g1_i27:13-978(-)
MCIRDRSRRKYFKELKRVIEESDVILQVLDVRDPMGCRNKELESQIIAKNKRIILILNKIDLVPSYSFCPTRSEVAIQWCAYLRREYATVLFKANTQEQAQKLSNIKVNAHLLKENPEVFKKVVGTSKTVGGDDLMQIIKNYSRQGDVKTSITVGVIGFPNVGKSSVINSLKKTKVASVSNVPGHTKTVQEVYLDKNVRLLDCPGIVLSNENADSALLRNVIKVEDLPDPYVPAEIITKKVSKEVLMKLYNVEDYGTTQELLANIARKRGRLLKGGVPDTGEAARLVLKDWNAGRIPFHTPCPITASSSEQIIVGETMEMA